MHEHTLPNQHNPPQSFTKISKTPKIFKNPKARSKMHECMKMKGFRTLTKRFKLDLG